MNGTHVPVLVKEVVDALRIEPGKEYIDATVGLGGHAVEIVKRGGIVLGIDRDLEALEIAKGKNNLKLVHGNFRDLAHIAKENGFLDVDGVLFDLGVSSLQLDTPQRGFSYRFSDGPLDLRMDQSQGDTAAQLVSRATSEELYDIFSSFGEEQLARPIADALYRTRSIKPVITVGGIVEIVATVVPNEKARYGVLSRVFQGLRIAVNDEFDSLKKGLEGASKVLRQGGRLVVISFHSREDRIVKQVMRTREWEVVTKHPVFPSPDEVKQNIRSRSAKLRVAIKIDS